MSEELTVDNLILEVISIQLSETRKIIAKELEIKGITEFEPSEQTKYIQTQLVSIIDDLQFYKILPKDFHVSLGVVIKHLNDQQK